MLVLTRQVGERIIIGQGENAVIVTMMESRYPYYKLSISAPKEIEINREEIYNRKFGEVRQYIEVNQNAIKKR